MPYDKQSFLNGLAAGLTATATTRHKNYIITKTSDIYPRRFLEIPISPYDIVYEESLYRIENPIYVSGLVIRSRYPVSITYTYGEKNNLKSETKIIPGSNESQIVHHVYRLPIDYLVNSRTNPDSPNYYKNYVYQIKFIFDKRMDSMRVYANYFDRLTVSGYIIPGFDANVKFDRVNYPGDPKLITAWKLVNQFFHPSYESEAYYWW